MARLTIAALQMDLNAWKDKAEHFERSYEAEVDKRLAAEDGLDRAKALAGLRAEEIKRRLMSEDVRRLLIDAIGGMDRSTIRKHLQQLFSPCYSYSEFLIALNAIDVVKKIIEEPKPVAVPTEPPKVSWPSDLNPVNAVTSGRTYVVVLKSVPEGKYIHAIKLVRELTTMGLKDAKDLVDACRAGATQRVISGISYADAQKAFKRFTEVGADAYFEAEVIS